MATKKPQKVLPAIKQRAERIEAFLKKIEQQKSKVPLDKIIGEFSLETGLSIRKIREYLKLLEDCGKIKINRAEDVEYVEYVEE